MAIRFHLDEHLSPAIADALRSHGIDVSTSQDAGLLGENDGRQLLFAVSQQRSFVTCDDHFLRQHMVAKATYGICYCHLTKHPIGEFVEALLTVARCIDDEEMHYCIQWL